ncbi:MAG TPA: peptide ABC transporter substrate-binding protein [Candidatus Sulfotelmatobacter sp.]|nr:peptide ABC transporter substrate-binding protein [Candidatus Sulfotelmatobacter sp.]
MRRLTIGALACALALGACTKVGDQTAGGTTAPNAGTVPGELRVAVQREPNSLNPILSAFTIEGFVNRLSFDNLIEVAGDGKTLVPDLATDVPTTQNGGISKDGLTITYHLRHGVKWQDGVPFTSKDVKFSWQAMVNPNNNVNTTVGYADIKSVDTPSDDVVVFHLKQKFAPFVNTIFAESDNPICIVPEHILGKFHDLNRIPFNEQPIGTGPFKVARWVRGDHIELVANPDYWRGAPKLKSIIVRMIPDENTEMNALRSHDVDFMLEPSPNLYTTLKTMPGVKVVLDRSPQALWMLMNTTRPPLNDVQVRRAIAYAIDKAALVDKFTGGSASIAWSDQPAYSWAYNPHVTQYPYSAAKAKQLLEQDGWTPGADGIMRKGGKPLSLQVSYNSENATRRLAAVEIQSNLHDAGIDVQVKSYPGNLFFATYGQGGILSTAKYDLAVSGWVAGIDPDDHSLYACDQTPPTGTNYTHYCSKEMDADQRAALASYDEGPRKAAYDKIQELIASDQPTDYLWFAVFPQAINPAFQGFDPNPINESWNAWQWSI